MKSIKIPLLANLLFLSGASAPLGAAGIDLVQDKQLAIALGAAVLVRDNGKDPLLWKEASALRNCNPLDGDDEVECRWSVYFVTEKYQAECPDGRVLDGVEGDGVHLYSGNTSKVFRWIRQPICKALDGQ